MVDWLGNGWRELVRVWSSAVTRHLETPAEQWNLSGSCPWMFTLLPTDTGLTIEVSSAWLLFMILDLAL